jgi:hypothetical protein
MQKGKWQKSLASSPAGHCVEVMWDGRTYYIRDSKHREGLKLAFTADEWKAFVVGVQNGELV